MSTATITFKDTDDGRILIDIGFDTEKPNVESKAHIHALEFLKSLHDSKMDWERKNEQSNSNL